MDKKEYLTLLTKEIHFFYDRKNIKKEFSDHLDDSIADLLAEGLSKDEAEKQAVIQMGNPSSIGKQLNQLHHPFIGWLWWLSEKAVLILLGLTLFLALFQIAGIIYTLRPLTVNEAFIERFSIHQKISTGPYHIEILDAYQLEENQAAISYRIYQNPLMTRSQDGIFPFTLDGQTGGFQSSAFLVRSGWIQFDLDENAQAEIVFSDGQVWLIDFQKKEVIRQ